MPACVLVYCLLYTQKNKKDEIALLSSILSHLYCKWESHLSHVWSRSIMLLKMDKWHDTRDSPAKPASSHASCPVCKSIILALQTRSLLLVSDNNRKLCSCWPWWRVKPWDSCCQYWRVTRSSSRQILTYNRTRNNRTAEKCDNNCGIW